MSHHIGRAWSGTTIEDGCPCAKAPCGLVDSDGIDPSCAQHAMEHAPTIRQSHPAGMCPARDGVAHAAAVAVLNMDVPSDLKAAAADRIASGPKKLVVPPQQTPAERAIELCRDIIEEGVADVLSAQAGESVKRPSFKGLDFDEGYAQGRKDCARAVLTSLDVENSTHVTTEESR